MANLNNSGWYEKLETYVAGGSSTGSKRAYLLPEEPTVIVKGKGCRVWDADGKEYIDYKNGLGPVSLGYAHPVVDQAVTEQLKNGIVFGQPNYLEAETAELICEVIPCAEKVRFLKTGGEACSACIKLARAYTGKDHIIQIGYNGWLNTLASGARINPREESKGAPKGIPQPISDLYHSVGWGDQATVSKLFEVYNGKIAAVIVAAGYADMGKGAQFYPFLREITKKNDTLLIYDEIVTGFRVATAGVQEYFNVVPDLAVFAKGMANGMPISIFCGKADIMDLVAKGVVISSTYGGETLSLAACKAVIELYKKENVTAYLWKAGEKVWTGLNKLYEKYNVPVEMKGFWPCPTFVNKEGAPKDLTTRILRAGFKYGVSLYSTAYVTYSHKDEDIDETIVRMDKAVAEVAGTL